MIIAMHCISTMHSNIRTDIRLAGENGFGGLEILDKKLLRYLDVGFKVEELLPHFENYSVRPVCINALSGIERGEPSEYAALICETERLCSAAEVLGCANIQLNIQLLPHCGPEGRSWKEVLELTAINIADIADIGKSCGVRFQLEPAAWTPIHSLSQSLELIERVGKDNVGLVIDFWQLWAGGETTPADVSALDRSIIYGVHFCDGIRHTKGTEWIEEDLRGFMPGEGGIAIEEWVAAVKATGFDGYWSCELLSPKHWEWDLNEVVRETKKVMEKYIL